MLLSKLLGNRIYDSLPLVTLTKAKKLKPVQPFLFGRSLPDAILFVMKVLHLDLILTQAFARCTCTTE
jgi:hypothetical protein